MLSDHDAAQIEYLFKFLRKEVKRKFPTVDVLDAEQEAWLAMVKSNFSTERPGWKSLAGRMFFQRAKKLLDKQLGKRQPHLVFMDPMSLNDWNATREKPEVPDLKNSEICKRHFFDGETIREIADTLKVTRSAVYQQLGEELEQLRATA